MIFRIALFSFFTLFLPCTSSWSGTPLITFTPRNGTMLPASVYPGQVAKAFYTVRNNTERPLYRLQTHSLPATVSQVVSDFVYSDGCSSTFTLAAGASCTLELNITGAALGGPVVCLYNGLSCYRPSSALSLNVAEVPDPTMGLVSLSAGARGASIWVGGQKHYTAIGDYGTETRDLSAFVTWASTKPEVAFVAPGGIASGLGEGVAQISASLNDVVSNSVRLTVSEMPSESEGSIPTITLVSPSSGTHCGGTLVTIFGTNFSDAISVWFGTDAASGFTVINDTTITATTPFQSTGTVDVTVTNQHGTSTTSSADEFTSTFLNLIQGC